VKKASTRCQESAAAAGVIGAPLVVEEGVLAPRVDLQVMWDASGGQLGLQRPGGLGGEVLVRP
jgi:hypothetical protein